MSSKDGLISFKGIINFCLILTLTFYSIRKVEGLIVIMLSIISLYLIIKNYFDYRWLGI